MLRSSRLAWLFACLCFVPLARAEPAAFAGFGAPIDDILESLRSATVKAARPVGTSSAVFKLDLDGPVDAAFRPESRVHPRGHLAELAAYRIGRMLGLDNIAPVVPRRIAHSELARLVKKTHPDAWAALETDLLPRDGQLVGVAIYWIPDMHELGLDTTAGMARFTRWLSQDIPLSDKDKERRLAEQMSNMLAFDYLVANFDRFSGANAQGDHSGQRLFIRDHNLSFVEPLRSPLHERVLGRLKRAQRFSRTFVAKLKAVSAETLSGALADPHDPPAMQLLSTAQLGAVLQRRKTILSYVSALVSQYGESKVLTFP